MAQRKSAPKRDVFIKEYLVDKNATRAAKVAGYSEKTAYSAGQRLLKNVEVKAAIEAGLAAQLKDAEARAKKKGITKDRWLREIARIAFADMDDFAKVTAGGSVDLTPSQDRKRGRSRVIKKLTESTSQHGGSTGIELHPKLPALELIGRHFGWIVQKHELTGKDGGPLESKDVSTPEERRKRLKELTSAISVLDEEDGSGQGSGSA